MGIKKPCLCVCLFNGCIFFRPSAFLAWHIIWLHTRCFAICFTFIWVTKKNPIQFFFLLADLQRPIVTSHTYVMVCKSTFHPMHYILWPLLFKYISFSLFHLILCSLLRCVYMVTVLCVWNLSIYDKIHNAIANYGCDVALYAFTFLKSKRQHGDHRHIVWHNARIQLPHLDGFVRLLCDVVAVAFFFCFGRLPPLLSLPFVRPQNKLVHEASRNLSEKGNFSYFQAVFSTVVCLFI